MHSPGDASDRFGLPGYDATTYGEAFADIYDLWYDDLDDDDFIEVLCASLPSGTARILELGVGTGRLLEKLAAARRGLVDEMTGVDASPRMLALARVRLGGRATLVEADFSESLPDGTFDLVFVGYNTLFNLPDEAALESCMDMVSRRLAPGGAFCLDTTCPTADAHDEPVSVRTIRAGEVVESVSRHDPVAQRIVGRFVHRTGGEETRIRPWAVRYWHPHQLDAVAGRAGMELVSRHTDGPEPPDASRAGGRRRDSGAGGRSISHYRVPTGNLRGQ